MICAKCGLTNDKDNKTCVHCNAELPFPAAGKNIDIHAADRNPEPGRDVFPVNLIHGRFTLIKVLGRGGMGEIFLAEDNKLQRKVAIKSIVAESDNDCDSNARLLREARAASQLDHPNICTIYEIAADQGHEYIIMQYVDGVTLDQLQRVKPLTISQVVDIALQISDGMIEAHARNIVHRDLKPGNIMIDKSGKVKILDFGLAKICPDKTAGGESNGVETDLTEKGVVMGTVAYMSPEQARGLELDGRSDIFSFGAVLFELLERKNPFADEESIVTLYNILHKPVTLSREIPLELGQIVQQAVQKDRDLRQNDFSEIKTALAAIRESMLRARLDGKKTVTEVIPSPVQEHLLKNGLPQRSSDNENLEEMVRRAKKLKASTEKLSS